MEATFWQIVNEILGLDRKPSKPRAGDGGFAASLSEYPRFVLWAVNRGGVGPCAAGST